jgi:dTDP-4-amino-4,6-dideoxygalactose transaminase/lipopolysaccharide/colanic/teichoic acid biosynthesis glycosyltransferase
VISAAPEVEFLPFAVPDVSEEEIAEVVDSLRSGWLTTGPKVTRFEGDFARYIGGDVHALAVNSATAGLHLALEAIGIGPGDEVITTTYTFTATAEVVRYLGGNPVFVDVDPVTLNMDPQSVEAAISPRTKAIIPVHIGGHACNMDEIVFIARRHGLRVIEDAAHAFPSRYRGRLIGRLDTDATVFSFYATKTLTTGEGGMVVTADRAIRDRCALMRLHGIDRDAFGRYTSTHPAWFYEVVAPGFKYNMTDVAASLGIVQLRRADQLHAKRTRMAGWYDTELQDLPIVLPARGKSSADHSWHLYVVRLTGKAPISRDDLVSRLSSRGIGTSVHFVPLHLHPYWQQQYRLDARRFPNATAAYKTVLSLPIYTKMSPDQQNRVIAAIRECLAPVPQHVVSRSGLADAVPLEVPAWKPEPASRAPLIAGRREGRLAFETPRVDIKRLFDIVVGAIALAIAFPVMLLIAAAVAVQGRPVIYASRRVGRFGRPFLMYKFRSMSADADSKGPLVVRARDKRVTRLGWTLRRWKLDELPQLVNVLRGEMSIVGPRPELWSYRNTLGRKSAAIAALRPGLSDWASIWNIDEAKLLARTSDPDLAYRTVVHPVKLELQSLYAAKRSVLLDVRILVATLLRLGIGLCWFPPDVSNVISGVAVPSDTAPSLTERACF